MSTQLFYWIVSEGGSAAVFFAELQQSESLMADLRSSGARIVEVDCREIKDKEDLLKVLSKAINPPPGYYGNEETYAPNEDALLEYLQDIEDWTPATRDVCIAWHAEEFWKSQPKLGGTLVELFQQANDGRKCPIRLVFVW